MRQAAIGMSLAMTLVATASLAQAASAGASGREDGLLAIHVDGKHGFIDRSGRIVIPPTFEFAWQFSEGLASAWRNGRAGYIDRTGKFVVPPLFEYAKAF